MSRRGWNLRADQPNRPGGQAAYPGERSPNWKGRTVKYRSAHTRVTVRHGRAADHECIRCGGPARDWAYDHTDPNEITDEKGRVYSPDPDHYQPMCRQCHIEHDGERIE